MLIFINDYYLMVISDAGSTSVGCFIRRSLLYISLVLSLTPPRHQGIHQFSSLSCLPILFAIICSIIIMIILNLINDSNLTIQNSQAASLCKLSTMAHTSVMRSWFFLSVIRRQISFRCYTRRLGLVTRLRYEVMCTLQQKKSPW